MSYYWSILWRVKLKTLVVLATGNIRLGSGQLSCNSENILVYDTWGNTDYVWCSWFLQYGIQIVARKLLIKMGSCMGGNEIFPQWCPKMSHGHISSWNVLKNMICCDTKHKLYTTWTRFEHNTIDLSECFVPRSWILLSKWACAKDAIMFI